MKYPGSLHNHSDFSNFRLRDSINTIESLIDRAVEIGHEVIAITEHDTIASSIRAEKYYNKIKEKNPDFKVILGNEIYLCRNGLNSDNFKVGKDKYYHFILLAKDTIGHQQIREISTRAWMRSYMARGMRRVPTYYQDLIDIIGQNPGHVIGSTACIGGALGTQLLIHKETEDNVLYHKIVLWVNQMKEIFGKENFFLEMQPSHNKDQIYVNEEIIHLSEICDVSYIVTNDSHYLIKEDLPIHEAFLNAQGGDREVKSFYATTYLMNDDEVREYMIHSDGVINEEILQKSYQNIVKIKDMCEDYSIMKPLKIPQLAWKKAWNNSPPESLIDSIPYYKKFLESDYEGDKELIYHITDSIYNDK